MICVIITAPGSDNFYPAKETLTSKSFLPLPEGRNVLSMTFSVLNTYFPRDKIYIVCSVAQYDQVTGSNIGIKEENIIVEPESINYSVSAYYSSLVIGRIVSDEVLFFFQADKLFMPEAKLVDWMSSCEAAANTDKLVFPIKHIDREEHGGNFTDLVVEAGKMSILDRNNEIYAVESINTAENGIKRRKLFGKHGKMLYIMAGSVSAVKNIACSIDEDFALKLESVLSADTLSWSDIIALYNVFLKEDRKLDFFLLSKGSLCLFTNALSGVINSWFDLLDLVRDGDCFSAGNVKYVNSAGCVLVNFDEETAEVHNMDNVVLIKKNGSVFCKKIC